MTPRHIGLTLLAGAGTLLAWETISAAMLSWPVMTESDEPTRVVFGSPWLMRPLFSLAIAGICLVAMLRLPRATTLQYAAIFGVAALAVSLWIGSSWSGGPAPWPWAALQVADRTIGFALTGLVMGAIANTVAPRSITDEWGGVRSQGGLPTATRNGSVRR